MDSVQIDRKISKSVALVSRESNYQRKLFTLLCIIWTQVAYNSLINPMVFTNPLFTCAGQKTTQAYYCKNLHNEACVYMNDFTGTHFAGLYCEDRDVRMALQSVFAVGSIIGLLVFPALSDSRGKKFAANICLLCMIVGNMSVFLGIFFRIHFMIAMGQLLSAMGSISIAAISYSINSDFFSDDLRQKAIIYYCAAWGLTDMSVLLVYYLVPYWMFFMIFLLIIPILTLYAYFHSFFLESPHFLIISQHNYAAAIQIIKKIGEYNNAAKSELQQSISIIQELQQSQSLRKTQKKQQSAIQTMRIIFGTPKYLKAVICLIFIKMAYYCFYFGVQGTLERTGFNFGISVFLFGLGEFTGYSTGSKFIPKLHRKTVLLVTNVLTASIGILYITKTVEQSPFLASLILYISFILNSMNFSAITLLETESFSSSLRSTAVGLIFSVSCLVRLIIPFFIGFLNERGIHTIIASSVLIVGLGVLPSLTVKETYGYSNAEEPLIEKEQIQLKSKSDQALGKTDF